MGQAFKPVFLAEDSDTVTGHLSPRISYKLAEHAYLGSWFVAEVNESSPHPPASHGSATTATTTTPNREPSRPPTSTDSPTTYPKHPSPTSPPATT